MTEPESIVMKFGGTSVEDAAAFRRVAGIVADRLHLRPIVVVSAMSGMTDALLISVELAAKGNPSAVVSLQPQFARHAAVAEELLTPAAAEQFKAELERQRIELEAWLGRFSQEAPCRLALQDAVVAFGE
ncbi:MAG TPA: hypothetical protein VJS64_10945, partial [Pyrinomonadaceae bacterium]|nr:hypothetical protein [Pyrinomonadaceae bacterium]